MYPLAAAVAIPKYESDSQISGTPVSIHKTYTKDHIFLTVAVSMPLTESDHSAIRAERIYNRRVTRNNIDHVQSRI